MYKSTNNNSVTSFIIIAVSIFVAGVVVLSKIQETFNEVAQGMGM